MQLNDLFGVPAHPLLVHLPLVLVPLAAICALVAVVLARHRRRLALLAMGVTALALISNEVAVASGRALRPRVPSSELVRRHVVSGINFRFFIIALLIVLLVLAMLPHSTWSGTRTKRQRSAIIAVGLLVVVTAGSTVVATIVVGYSGTKAVWSDTPQRPAP